MPTMQEQIGTILLPYQQRIEQAIRQGMMLFGPPSALRNACEYALTTGGKRFRPALVYIIADALGAKNDVSLAALAIEYFHTASLVADDLPCMDNDAERRNKPTVHRAYDETTALLVTYALIAAGYEAIAKNAKKLGLDRVCALALENAALNTGIMGATGGQYLDMFPPDLTLETVRETLHKKTVTLFEISFVFGWLFGGGAEEKLHDVKKAAHRFGLAFQIADDLGDMQQDALNGRKVNIATLFGEERARRMFHGELEQFFATLDQLGISSPALNALADLLVQQASC